MECPRWDQIWTGTFWLEFLNSFNRCVIFSSTTYIFQWLPPDYEVTAFNWSIWNFIHSFILYIYSLVNMFWVSLEISVRSTWHVIQFCHFYYFQRDFYEIYICITPVLRISQEFACLPKKFGSLVKNWSRKTVRISTSSGGTLLN